MKRVDVAEQAADHVHSSSYSCLVDASVLLPCCTSIRRILSLRHRTPEHRPVVSQVFNPREVDPEATELPHQLMPCEDADVFTHLTRQSDESGILHSRCRLRVGGGWLGSGACEGEDLSSIHHQVLRFDCAQPLVLVALPLFIGQCHDAVFLSRVRRSGERDVAGYVNTVTVMRAMEQAKEKGGGRRPREDGYDCTNGDVASCK